jgi:hypothetical protein
MKRISSSATVAGEGVVFRDLDDPEKACFPTPEIIEITSPGCIDLPDTDNSFAALPNSFGGTVSIDPEDYVDFVAVTTNLLADPYDPEFVNLWSAFQEEGLADTAYLFDCYCPGEGYERVSLSIGQPRFPSIPPLPFFWIPPFILQGGAVEDIEARLENPDSGSKAPTCCPGSEFGNIKGSIVGDSVVFQREDFAPPRYMYRSTDRDELFLMQAGYPRWCCIKDTCDSDSSTYRYLHFPRWLENDRNPYDEMSTPEEPVGVISFVTDIKCNTSNGELEVYYGQMIFHWGTLHKVLWNTAQPTPTAPGSPPSDPNPSGTSPLAYNKNYDGSDLISLSFIGPLCDDSCRVSVDHLILDAKIDMGLGCPTADCPSGICQGGESMTTVSEVGATYSAAVAGALSDAISANPCGENAVFALCFVEKISATWTAKYAICCPP